MTEKTLTEVEIKLAELRRKNAQSLAKLSAAGLAMAGAIVEASEEEFFTKQELRLIRSCQRYANDDEIADYGMWIKQAVTRQQRIEGVE